MNVYIYINLQVQNVCSDDTKSGENSGGKRNAKRRKVVGKPMQPKTSTRKMKAAKRVKTSACLSSGFEQNNEIESKIPIYDVNRSSCLCHNPLRTCSTPGDISGFANPMNCFNHFFEELIRFTTLESNKYAISRGFHQEIICEPEMTAFLGVIVNSMYVKVNQRNLYWSTDRDTHVAGIADLLTRKRFEEIMRSLHFRDNKTMPIPNTDKFFKVRPLFRNLNTRLEVFSNSSYVSIDESMQPYFGYHSTKQYMKGKPHKFGFKIWYACNPSGLPLFVEPYAGVSTEIPNYGLGKSGNIVAHAVTRLNLLPGTQVVADNFFMSPSLLKWSTDRKIGLTGTLRANRLGSMPKPEHDGNKGSYDSIVDTENQIIYTAWQDRKNVLVASNTFSCEPLQAVTVGKGSRQKSVLKPQLIVKYNQAMGGVDLLDFWLSILRPRIRSRKWYWPLYSWVISTSLVAAWKLWQSHTTQLAKKGSKGGFLRNINNAIRRDTFQRKLPGPEHILVNDEVRFDNIGHLVNKGEAKRDCSYCNQINVTSRRRTVYFCIKCNVGIHPDTCFVKYHTR